MSQPSLVAALVQIAAIWIGADIGYYMVLPTFGIETNYNSEPLVLTLYYAVWIVVTLIYFRTDLLREMKVHFTLSSIAFLFISAAMLMAFSISVLPNLNPVVWHESWSPPDLLMANAWYFLPKSIEILLQQILIALMVYAFASRGLSLRMTTVYSVLLFGGAHVLLVFGALPLLYVLRFIIAASLFGLVFPFLLLRVPNGFIYSYTLQWLYYVLTILMMHAISPYVG